ncbi:MULTISPECIES: hypothetical protein [Pseudomonas]|uniref:hypothetical protein n=1 Tax=Pseudomonas TaxID=286 RepID=UPI001F285BEF|nr:MULTISPECIES: hypothetical protein [Pseudomonas]
MAKRYGLSDEAWGVISDLFIETHGRGRPRLSDRLIQHVRSTLARQSARSRVTCQLMQGISARSSSTFTNAKGATAVNVYAASAREDLPVLVSICRQEIIELKSAAR